MDAETYLRNLAESELRRNGGDALADLQEATGRVRAVAAELRVSAPLTWWTS